MLIDSDWFWSILIDADDADWFWLMQLMLTLMKGHKLEMQISQGRCAQIKKLRIQTCFNIQFYKGIHIGIEWFSCVHSPHLALQTNQRWKLFELLLSFIFLQSPPKLLEVRSDDSSRITVEVNQMSLNWVCSPWLKWILLSCYTLRREVIVATAMKYQWQIS